GADLIANGAVEGGADELIDDLGLLLGVLEIFLELLEDDLVVVTDLAHRFAVHRDLVLARIPGELLALVEGVYLGVVEAAAVGGIEFGLDGAAQALVERESLVAETVPGALDLGLALERIDHFFEHAAALVDVAHDQAFGGRVVVPRDD